MEKDELAQGASASHVGPDHQLPPPRPEPHRSRTVGIVIWVLILLLFALLFWAVLHHQQTAKPPSGRGAMAGPVTVTVATAKKGDIGVYLNAIGTVTPVYTDAITSQVTGVVLTVHYREGQMVRRGDPLIDIDPRPYRAQLLQAQGALERDVNLLAQARMDLQRYQAAWARNAIARQILEDQQKLVLQDEGTVKVDQGLVQYDQVQVAFCHLTAPISGRVGLRLVDPGNVVQANSTTPLVILTQIDPITVVFTIAEDAVGQVMAQMRYGKTLQVTAFDRGNEAKIATGRLQTIDNQIDTTTGTVKLRAIFPNKNDALFPNLFVNTKLLVDTLHNVTLVPSSTVQQNGEVSYVFVIRNGTAHMRDVKTGISESGETVVEGVNPGDVIADSSFQKLQDKSKVVLSKTPLPATTSGSNAP
ncbi:MAG TPA: efflux RND transporter periplasmic adaptor subunit [Acidobacteriaceae bacterium]|nr:efflux RND transporter periplasmic adaptor subunit [Acidobacteriaceae bacterium]